MKVKKKINISGNATYLGSKSEIKKARKKQLLQANLEEDKSIKRLEKLLKLNKKKKGKETKKKKLPSAFIDDGLDYLLDVIENKESSQVLSDDSLGEELPDLGKNAAWRSKRKPGSQPEGAQQPKKQRTLTDLLREKEGHVSESDHQSGDSDSNDSNRSIDEDEFDENSNASDEGIDDSHSDGAEQKPDKDLADPINESKPEVWEDIYGRLRDAEGNVIKSQAVVPKYVPPRLRKSEVSSEKQEQLQKLKKTLKGLLNRLSESNMHPISHQIEDLYMKYSRNDVNETLFSLVCDLVLSPIATAPRLILEEALLIALLHANVGPEIGAYFLQHLVEKLDSLFKTSDYGEGKTCNNVLTFISHLYNFKVTHSSLIFDIFRKLIDSFQSKDIELIQMFLKNIGFVLRKDDPLSLKEIILSIQNKASSVNKEQNDSRVNFMLETLTAIRNNNIYKIPDYDPSIIDHSKKLMKGFIRKGCSLQELAVSYEDLLKAEERGRWWIVGSAWAERDTAGGPKEKKLSGIPQVMEFGEKILQLAQKQHMNTDVRKSIFCILMTAEDFMDAFEKLLKLNLKGPQQREIINVTLHCLLREKNFNPYYALLAEKFCKFSRTYQRNLSCSLWDKLKDFNNLKPHQMKNLSGFLSHCFVTSALPLSVLKVISFSQMDKMMLKFFRQILLSILLHESEEICAQVFLRISNGKQLNLLRESLRLFMHEFLLKNKDKYSPETAAKLEERVTVAENALTSAKRTFKL